MEEKKEPTKWEKYAKGKKPSMKRRCNLNDYCDRGIYMITIAIEGRRPLLGRLAGDTPEEAYVVLSAFGERVKTYWMAIPQFYPQIEVVMLCMMPDHIHGILFVHERIERHLGHVINGFKTGCRKAAREMGIIAAALPLSTERKEERKEEKEGSVEYTAAVPQLSKQPSRQPSKERSQYDRHHGLLWEENYNDRILQGRGQLNAMFRYLQDNPRRLWIKRNHPEFFKTQQDIIIGGQSVSVMGNRFLLDSPNKVAVKCSRRMTDDEIGHATKRFLMMAQRGAVLVSPRISPGEKAVMDMIQEAGFPFIQLLENGFSPMWKPGGEMFNACANGQVLLVAPWPYHSDRNTITRDQCNRLNDLAALICSMPPSPYIILT